MIGVLATGPLATVQDLGRPGFAALGVPRAGAFDRAAARLANRLVGNPPSAALIEVTFGGLAVYVHDAVTVAVAGAACDGPLDWGTAQSVGAGHEIRLGRPAIGVRTYLAVRGGLAVAAVLGSASTDLLSGLGPAPLAVDDQLVVGPEPAELPSATSAAQAPRPASLRVIAGPRADWFEPAALDLLAKTSWTVRAECDRVGVRLDGPKLTRRRGGELPSEPTRPGAIQIPPDGRPIVFGPDAPTIGGYPVLGVIADRDLDHVGQLRPGDSVRFAIETG